MGFEMTYQAIPADCGQIERARSEVEVGESLAMLPYWLALATPRPAPGREAAAKGPLWNWCCRLAGERPELLARNCDLGRTWDALHYLLSATRRGAPATPRDQAFDRAFDAGELVAEHARAGQGVPVRYLTPAHVRAVAEAAGPLRHASLAAHYHPARMEAAAVYKFRADRADEAEWRSIAERFDALRAFLLAAAEAGDGVVVVRD